MRVIGTGMVAETVAMSINPSLIPYFIDNVRNMEKNIPVGRLARVTSKGQITVPKAVREALGAEPGDTLFFSIAGDQVVVHRIKRNDELPPIEIPAHLRGKSMQEIRDGTADNDAARGAQGWD